MGSIDVAFSRSRAEDRAALIVYLMAGDPSLAATAALMRACVDGGADLIELGFAYSDPIADGPTIAAAGARALATGLTFEATMSLDVRSIGVPVVAFGYWNPYLVRGPERTVGRLAHAGYAGAIVADLPPEEGAALHDACQRDGLALPLLIAPTTPRDRLRRIARASTGFLYAVSRLGVTGARDDLAGGVEALVGTMKSETDLPVAVGFGISNPAQAHEVARYADGVVVGSAIIDIATRATSLAAACAAVTDACRAFSTACRKRDGALTTASCRPRSL